VSTVRWASEIGSAFSQLLKDRIDRLMGILSTNHELYVL
jgi:hypothetical protein